MQLSRLIQNLPETTCSQVTVLYITFLVNLKKLSLKDSTLRKETLRLSQSLAPEHVAGR